MEKNRLPFTEVHHKSLLYTRRAVSTVHLSNGFPFLYRHFQISGELLLVWILRPPLDKELFPVHCPSGLKRADWNFFFSDFQQKNIFHTFPPCTFLFIKKDKSGKKKRNPDRPTGNDYSPNGGLRVTAIILDPKCLIKEQNGLSKLSYQLFSIIIVHNNGFRSGFTPSLGRIHSTWQTYPASKKSFTANIEISFTIRIRESTT